MSILVACQCGQRFTVLPDVAGQLVMCPACESWFDVPVLISPDLVPLEPAEPIFGAIPAEVVALTPERSPVGRPEKALATAAPASPSGNRVWVLAAVAGILVAVLLFASAATALLIGYQLARGSTSKPAPTVAKAPVPRAAPDPTATHPPESTSSSGDSVSSSTSKPGTSSKSPSREARPNSPPVPENRPPAAPQSPATPPAPPAEPNEPAVPKLPEGWRTYTSDSARFSVGFPGLRVDQRPVAVPSPRLLDNFVSASENGSVAMVLVHDMTAVRVPGFQTRVASDMLDQMLAPAGAHDVERNEVTVFGHEGLFARFLGKIAGREAVFQVKVFAVHGWVYQVVWVMPVDKVNEADAESFFASFQLTDIRKR